MNWTLKQRTVLFARSSLGLHVQHHGFIIWLIHEGVKEEALVQNVLEEELDRRDNIGLNGGCGTVRLLTVELSALVWPRFCARIPEFFFFLLVRGAAREDSGLFIFWTRPFIRAISFNVLLYADMFFKKCGSLTKSCRAILRILCTSSTQIFPAYRSLKSMSLTWRKTCIAPVE